eukprot:g30384.t1
MRRYVQQVKQKPLPPFYNSRDPRPYARREPKNKLSQRLAKDGDGDVSAQIGKLVQNETSVFIWLRASSLPTIVLILVSVLRLCLRWQNVAQWLVHSHYFMAGIILSTWLLQEALELRRHTPARAMIQSMIDRMVAHDQKHLLNELLQAIDVPTLLLCGPRTLQERLTEDALKKHLLEPFTKAILVKLGGQEIRHKT